MHANEMVLSKHPRLACRSYLLTLACATPNNPTQSSHALPPMGSLQVYAQAESEFNLVRTKLILKTWESVLEDRVPPPLNLVVDAIRIVVDAVGEILLVLGLMPNQG